MENTNITQDKVDMLKLAEDALAGMNKERYVAVFEAKDKGIFQVRQMRIVPSVEVAKLQAKNEGGWTHIRIFAFKEEIKL